MKYFIHWPEIVWYRGVPGFSIASAGLWYWNPAHIRAFSFPGVAFRTVYPVLTRSYPP